MIKEFFAIARVAQQDRKLPGFRAQQYYFFLVSIFYLYGRWEMGAACDLCPLTGVWRSGSHH